MLKLEDNPFAKTPTSEYVLRGAFALASVLLFAKIPNFLQKKNPTK